jgi:plastocyanin
MGEWKVLRSSRFVIIVACAALLTACGPDPDDSFGATTTAPPETTSAVTFPANGETTDLSAIDNNFVPQTLEVKAGTEVVFTNNGRNPHNVVPEGDPKATTWGVLDVDFDPADTYSRVFDRPGTYVFYCTIHGSSTAGMFGTISVTEP